MMKEMDFTSLYDSQARSVYRFIYYRVGHRPTAEDLTAATFLKALEHFRAFRPEQASERTWLYAIARNTVVDYYRTSKHPAPLEHAAGVADDTDLADQVDSGFATAEAREYLGLLSSGERQLVIMRLWDELSYREIAQLTGKSEAAAKMMFSRAIGKIRVQK